MLVLQRNHDPNLTILPEKPESYPQGPAYPTWRVTTKSEVCKWRRRRCSPGCRRDETRLRLRPRRWPLSPLRRKRAQSYSTYVACGSRKSDFQLCHLVHSMCNGALSPQRQTITRRKTNDAWKPALSEAGGSRAQAGAHAVPHLRRTSC